jgi:threonine dehydratase
MAALPVTIADVEAAAERIRGYANVYAAVCVRFAALRTRRGVPCVLTRAEGEGVGYRTPTLTCHTLDALCDGRRLFFKCENLQKVGAFKFRGACNAVRRLPEDVAARGVVTHSSGNHAQALALAARLRGVPAYIVMPSNAPEVKKAAVRGYGGRITECVPTLAARETTSQALLDATGGTLIHPFNHPDVIAGQGTLMLELADQVAALGVPALDALIGASSSDCVCVCVCVSGFCSCFPLLARASQH